MPSTKLGENKRSPVKSRRKVVGVGGHWGGSRNREERGLKGKKTEIIKIWCY